MSGSCKPIQGEGKGPSQSPLAFSISALLAGLLLALIPAGSVSGQNTKTYKIGAPHRLQLTTLSTAKTVKTGLRIIPLEK
jgi:hypothetical protein